MVFQRISSRIKQIKSWRTLVIWGVGFFLGILTDSFVQVTGKVFIYVSADYLGSVFGATCSVAVLGNAVLSLLFGSSEKVIRGVPFQDILHYTKFGSDQELTIVATMWSIPFAVGAYAADLYSTLTMICFLDAFLILASSLDLWQLLSNKEKEAKVVDEVLSEAPLVRCNVYVDNWFKELEAAVISNNESAIQEFCDLLQKMTTTVSTNDHPINKAIAHHMPTFFEFSCGALGFPDAYKLFKRINHIREEGFVDCEETALEYIKSLKYSESINVHNRHIPVIFKEIIDKLDASEWEKEVFACQYFRSVFYNTYLNDEARSELLKDILGHLCLLRDDEGGATRKQIILLIIKFDILLNEDENNRITLFHTLVESLLRKNPYSHDQNYISTIAEIFQAFFFYIYQEKETLKDEYRCSLAKLYRSKPSRKDSNEASFNRLVIENREDIIVALAEYAVLFERRRNLFWDYFSPTASFKRIVWSSNDLTRFVFCLYKMIGFARNGNPFIQIVESDQYLDEEKLSACRIITSLYSQGNLNEDALNMISKIEEMTGIRGHRVNYSNAAEYNYFQDKMLELQTKRNQSSLDDKLTPEAEIVQLVIQEVEKSKVFFQNDALPLHPARRHRIEPHLVEINQHQPSCSADWIASIVKMLINDVIDRKLKKVNIDFGFSGINKLISALSGEQWSYRNYKHVNDYAISPAVRETEEFVSLCNILDGIRYDRSREISSYVFLKQDKLQYNMSIRYHLEDPTDAMCSEFVERHQVTDGVYQIGSNRYDYSHAIKFVRNNYRLEIVDLLVHVDIDKDSGFIVEFEHT